MSGERRPGTVDAWWNAPGPDYCEFCHHTFQVEIGYHCVDCDRPVCPMCVVTVREQHTVICPECESPEGQD